MSRYKVAQDVEAEDKILGPFSFRQFIYLLVAAAGIALAWGLSQVFLPLAVIPVPIILLFGALALPLRKDQPMEVYLAAVVSFYTKPRRRMWQPDGINSLIEITVPEKVEIERTKNLSQDEAERRLAYLSQLADTHGWSIRHTRVPDAQGSMISDVYFEAQQTSDMFDDNSSEARAMTRRIEQSNQARRRAAIERMQAPPAALPAVADGQPLQQAPVPYQPAWPQVQAQQQSYHAAPQATPNTPPQATPPYQPLVDDAGFAPVSPPQPRMPESPYSAPEPQRPAVSYSSTSFPENRMASSHQQAPSPDASAYQNQPNLYSSQQSSKVYEISPVDGAPRDETPTVEPQPMPQERDSLQSLPMALPAVIPHDSVLPDALSKPYTPSKPTAEAAPELKPEEAPSFEAIYANLRQHTAPTTDAIPLVPPQKSATHTTTAPSYPSAEATPPADTQPSFTPAPAEQPIPAAAPNYSQTPMSYPPQQPTYHPAPPQQPPVAPAQPMPASAPTPAAVSYRDRSALADDKNVIDMAVRYNPYPSIHQSVIQPLDPSYYAKTTPTREERLREEQFAQQRNNMPPNTSANTVSPDIIRLASNSDLSVAAIANEANRIQHQEQASQDDDDDEIVIPLR